MEEKILRLLLILISLSSGALANSISSGLDHACAITSLGVECWGNNSHGQLNTPQLNNPIQISSGDGHSCVIDDVGVRCWGKADHGQLDSPNLVNPYEVGAGELFTCALDELGVSCWGDNQFGQLLVPVLSNPYSLSVGSNHACVTDDTGVHCWGNNSHGQLSVPDLKNPAMVSAGHLNTCAIDKNGLVCWGNESSGLLELPILINPYRVEVGSENICAKDMSGVQCWGENTDGSFNVPNLQSPYLGRMYGGHICLIDENQVNCLGSFNTTSGNINHQIGRFKEIQTLVADDLQNGDRFGSSVSIDSNKAYIGADESDTSGFRSGAVYEFSKNNDGSWYQSNKITPTDAQSRDRFGASVFLSENILYIGAPGDDGYGVDSGSMYLFNRGNDDFTLSAKINNPDPWDNFGQFGASVSVYNQDRFIGAPDTFNYEASTNGSIYTWNGASSQEITLSDSNTNSRRWFGDSVSLFNNYALIGARYSSDVFAYEKNVNWQQSQVISDAGAAVSSISIDGNLAAIGKESYSSTMAGIISNAIVSGKVSLYERNLNGVWENTYWPLYSSNNSNGEDFGSSVSLKDDVLFIGAAGKDGSRGIVYVFEKMTPIKNDVPALIFSDKYFLSLKGQQVLGSQIVIDENGLSGQDIFSIIQEPNHGAVVLDSQSGDWSYQPNSLFTGDDSFTIGITDDGSAVTTYVIKIRIDDDDDLDQIFNSLDNCPSVFNQDQSDIDGDLLGDVCDADMDGDGFANAIENTFGGDETDNSDFVTVMEGIEAFSVSDEPLDRAVPAMGGIGLLALGLSMLGLGAVRLRRK